MPASPASRINLNSAARDTLLCLFLHGPTFDGDVPSKFGRDLLYHDGLIQRGMGYQWLTEAGVRLCLELRFEAERSRRRHEAYLRHTTQTMNTGFDDDEG